MLPNRLAHLVREPIEYLLVVVARDARPQPAEEARIRARELHVWNRLQPERPREVRLEEGLEDLVGEDDHAESETFATFVSRSRERGCDDVTYVARFMYG